MKKSVLIVVIVGLVVAGGVFGWQRLRSQSSDTPGPADQKRRIESLNTIDLSQRPYVQLTPHANGRNVSLTVDAVPKSADSVEYELEYQAGSLLQGAFGQLQLAELPITEEVLLGSCSAGGSCTYHEDVKGGSLLLRFSGDDRYALKQDWRYIINSDNSATFSSRDAKFQLESTDLSRTSYLIIYNTPGLPEMPDGQVVSDPYALQTSGQLSGAGQLSIRATEEGNLTIMGWDEQNQEWVSFDTTTDGKTATAEVELLPVYVVVRTE